MMEMDKVGTAQVEAATWRGLRVAIIGSAPGCVLPSREQVDLVVAANGGAALAHEAGWQVDAIFTTSWLLGQSLLRHRETVRRLKGTAIDQVWIDVSDAPSTNVVMDRLRETGILYRTAIPVGEQERGAIVRASSGEDRGTGDPMFRVSTGVFAACVALWAGASMVHLCGISLQPGHSGVVPEGTGFAAGLERHHVHGDRVVLGALAKRRADTVRSTSPELIDAFGFERER